MTPNRPKDERGSHWTLQEIAEYFGMKKNAVYKKVIFEQNAPKPIYKDKTGYYEFNEIKKFIEQKCV